MKPPAENKKNLSPEKIDVTDKASDGWDLIETAPRDGTIIEAKFDPDDPDNMAMALVWRKTTRRDHLLRRWVPTGFWSVPYNRDPIVREPFCWRMPDGFVNPGMMVA